MKGASNQIFSELRVVELSSVLAGPAVGMFFAELGAEVLKIENARTGGDVTRHWKLPVEKKESASSAYYHAVNWGKRSEMLDFSVERDLLRAKQWISKADVVISNYRLSSATKFGLDYESIKQWAPHVIFGHVSGFGWQEERPAYDIVLQAETGFLSMMGSKEGELVRMPVALIDVLAAHQLKEGILIGLLQKMKTGKGCCVTVSLVDTAIASLANQASNYLNAGFIPGPMGILHPNIAPYGEMLTTADNKRYILAIGTDLQFGKLCDILTVVHLTTDPKFAVNVERVRNRSELHRALQDVVAALPGDDFYQKCMQKGVPIGEIRDLKEVFDQKNAQLLVIEDKNTVEQAAKCVRSIVFNIT